jgi:uncharacterized membrane protein YdfJ with MMPL/SSD domain
LLGRRRFGIVRRMESRLARLAGLVSRRRRVVLIIWVGLFVASAPLAAGQVERLSGGGWDVPGSGFAEANALLQQFPSHRGELVGVFVEGESRAAVDAALARAQERAARNQELEQGGPVQRLDGGRAALVSYRYLGERGKIYDFAAEFRGAVVADGDGARVRVVGDGAMWSNFQEVSKEQLAKAELIGFPFIVAILLAAFATLLAAAMPLVLAAVAVTVTGAAVFLLAGPFEISIYVTNMASMIGIGVAVDYSLFVVARYRRRLRERTAPDEALRDALASAGTAVVYSGATVVLSLASLFLVDVNAIRSMAMGAIVVVSVAVLATVTLLPALLALSGRRIERLRVRLPFRRPRENRSFWLGWSRRVMARPGLALGGGAALLLLLASPLLWIETGNGALEQLPRGAEVRVATERLAAVAGPGALGPIQVVTRDARDAERIAEGATSLAGVVAVRPPLASPDGSTHLVEVVPAAHPESEEAQTLLDRVETLAAADRQTAVGGATAFGAAMDDAVFGGLWKVIAFVLACSYLVLFLLLRSILLPLKAVLMNVLSVGAAYGFLVAVFQWGWLDWTGYESPGYVDTIVPVLLLAVVFGLSMDYEVFLLTRIRERYREGASNADAVAQGLATSARTITAAALIMVAVFGSFALAGASSLKQIGLGLAVAIFIDATVVRLVLVPATMKLLGDWNWWLPVSLRRLLGGGGAEGVAAPTS